MRVHREEHTKSRNDRSRVRYPFVLERRDDSALALAQTFARPRVWTFLHFLPTKIRLKVKYAELFKEKNDSMLSSLNIRGRYTKMVTSIFSALLANIVFTIRAKKVKAILKLIKVTNKVNVHSQIVSVQSHWVM